MTWRKFRLVTASGLLAGFALATLGIEAEAWRYMLAVPALMWASTFWAAAND